MAVQNLKMQRGISMWKNGYVEHNGKPGQYFVTSATDYAKRYLTLTPWAEAGVHCECWDWQERGGYCKHIVAATLQEAETRIRGELAGGRSMREVKNELMRWGLTGVKPAQDLIWCCMYEVACELEDGELDWLPSRRG